MPVSSARRHRSGSVFSKPVKSHLDRNLVARILFAAEALDRRTRAKGQHGGLLKGKGLDVLRALLLRFYCHRTGLCFPGYDAIAKAAACARSTVAVKLKLLAELGIIEIVRRKVVARFVSKVHHLECVLAVQTSNSYSFPLSRLPRVPGSDHRPGTSIDVIKREARGSASPQTVDEALSTMDPALAEALRGLGKLVDAAHGPSPS